MGRHAMDRLPVRELRSAYTRLLHVYGRLLREHHELLKRVPPAPSTEVELWRPRPTVWGTVGDAMSVEDARRLVRESGLLVSAGG